MSEAARSEVGRKRNQSQIQAKITPEEKKAVKKLAVDLGIPEGELVARWIRAGLRERPPRPKEK